MSEVVGVASLKCKDVQDVTISVEHMLPNVLNFWFSKFVCEEHGQEKWRALSAQFVFLLVCVINCHLREKGGEDALNFLNKLKHTVKRQVNCYIIVVIEMSNLCFINKLCTILQPCL